jgi:hypothetical protein
MDISAASPNDLFVMGTNGVIADGTGVPQQTWRFFFNIHPF